MIQAREKVKKSDDVFLLTKFVREGDEDAFSKIVGKYQSLVWNLCCRILHNRCDAEDAFQTTFLLLATKAHRIRKPKSLSSWLYGVAYRTASSIRRQRQRGMLPYENSVDRRLTEDVLEAVARKNENELVSAEIMLMKEKHKTPLLMFYFMGNSTTQIAESLGTTISTVEGRLRRAKNALKLKLRMRGVSFDETLAALVVPVLVFNSSLKFATISKALAASMTKSTACLLSKFTFGSNKIGAKLMFSKIALSIGIVCVTSAGLLHHAVHSNDDGELVQVNSSLGEQYTSTVPIKFVQDEEDENSHSVHEHLIEMHNHIYGVYQRWTNRFFEAEESDIIELRVESDIDDSGKNVFLRVTEDNERLSFEHAPGTHRAVIRSIGDNQDVFEYKLKVVEEPQSTSPSRIPLLEKLPIIGQLFHNEVETFEFEVIDEKESGEKEESDE